MKTPNGTFTLGANGFEIRDKDGTVRARFGDMSEIKPSPRYVKWNVVTRAVEDVNTNSWPNVCSDRFIYYREPNQGDNVWYAYACRTGIGTAIPADGVPLEVKLALVLSQ